jgi:hypothetical protein
MEKSILQSVPLTVVGLLCLISCTTTSSGPKPGTPEFFWISAQAAYKSGDFIKADEMLSRVLSTDNSYTTRARVAQIVLTAGLAKGYTELGDTYAQGARMTRTNPTPFRKQVSTARSTAAQYSLQFTDSLHRLMDSSQDANVPLAIPYPDGSLSDLPQIERLKGGALVLGSDAESLQNYLIQRGVISVANRLGGAEDDVSAAMDAFKLGSMTRDKFLFAAANLLYDQTNLFGSGKLDQPKRMYVLCSEALEALALIPATRETKALEIKIKKLMPKVTS